jgi:hypothetical protein
MESSSRAVNKLPHFSPRPSWGILYLILTLFFLGMSIDPFLRLSTTGHRNLEICLLLTAMSMISIWYHANHVALSGEQRRKAANDYRQATNELHRLACHQREQKKKHVR